MPHEIRPTAKINVRLQIVVVLVLRNGFPADDQGDTPDKDYYDLETYINHGGRPSFVRQATYAFVSTTLNSDWNRELTQTLKLNIIDMRYMHWVVFWLERPLVSVISLTKKITPLLPALPISTFGLSKPSSFFQLAHCKPLLFFFLLKCFDFSCSLKSHFSILC